MYLVTSLTVTAKQREVGAGRIVVRSVVVQTLRVYSCAVHLAGADQENINHINNTVLTPEVRLCSTAFI